MDLVYKYRERGYSTDYLFDFSIATDIKNSSFRTIYFDQGQLGMSREYLIKGELVVRDAKEIEEQLLIRSRHRTSFFSVSLPSGRINARHHLVIPFSGLEDEDVGHYYSYMQKVSGRYIEIYTR